MITKHRRRSRFNGIVTCASSSRETGPSEKEDRKLENAVHPKVKVSSTVFFHKFEAPTLPPVAGSTAYKREEDLSSAIGVGKGALPLRYCRHKPESALWDDRCALGYNGIILASVFNRSILNSTSGSPSHKEIIVWVNFVTLGRQTCRWNSDTSIAEQNIIRHKLTVAFRTGVVSFRDRTRKAIVSHCWACSIMTDFERSEVLCARQSPAHFPGASLECKREYIRDVHLVRCGDGDRCSEVSISSIYGRF